MLPECVFCRGARYILPSKGVFYWTFSNKVRKNLDFGIVFGSQNHEKSKKNGVENHVFFGHRFFIAFFSMFRDLGLILGSSGGSKNHYKIEKNAFGIVFERVWDPVSILDKILERFWWTLGEF